MDNPRVTYFGIGSFVLIILLTLVFMFLNPYGGKVTVPTKWICVTMLLLPALSGILFWLSKRRVLLIISILWIFPYSLYLGLASIPSLWNLYVLTFMINLLVLVRIRRKPSVVNTKKRT
ncbi:hypothetical protein [Paenibacillus guangzhouensis]|uniref:hypothetical protein n=1 Tax=Paenibacillus guangzhouensis TaxID=1473112 RepID=UPI001266BFBD|nr:hypothetical protein [Paenibacillus guangzhouensis]